MRATQQKHVTADAANRKQPVLFNSDVRQNEACRNLAHEHAAGCHGHPKPEDMQEVVLGQHSQQLCMHAVSLTFCANSSTPRATGSRVRANLVKGETRMREVAASCSGPARRFMVTSSKVLFPYMAYPATPAQPQAHLSCWTAARQGCCTV